MDLFGDNTSFTTTVFLLLALALAFGFEMVNGFHDTANAVATVIYTHTLRPTVAVVWSGVMNLLGVVLSNGAVAFGIVALLPIELVLDIGSGAGFAMIFSLLISAMIWNLGTWYLGLPASSTHTLVGSIIGVGLANSMFSAGHHFGEGVNWGQAKSVLLSLLVSPVVGFVGSALLLLLLKRLIKKPALFQAPEKDQPPPPAIRGLLFLTCTAVSFFHGSNDGQKGMGLVVLILVGILPAHYALNPATRAQDIRSIVQQARKAAPILSKFAPTPVRGQGAAGDLSHFLKIEGPATTKTYEALAGKNQDIIDELSGRKGYAELDVDQRKRFRSDIYLMSTSTKRLIEAGKFSDPADVKVLNNYVGYLVKETQYIPLWVKIAVACSLGFGTMVGWKRIVVTVGEKIGKEHLTYGEGAAAEIIAAATIGTLDKFGLPVSTTHVLSSGIAGTMAANHSGLQVRTLRNIILAWVLTLPVCVLLGAGIFSFALYLLFHIFGVH